MSAPIGHLPSGRAHAPRWPRLPASFVAGTLLLAVVAGLLGWLGRGASGPEPGAPPAPPHAVSLGPVGLSVPGAWMRARPAEAKAAGVPEVGKDVAVFAPVPGLSARAVLTLAPFDDATLVPAPLRELVGPAKPRKTTLAGLPAWTYRPQAGADGRTTQVTVAPTTAGSITAVCVAGADAWSAAVNCAGDLGDANLHGATSLVPSATLAFRRRLTPVLDHLGARRAKLRGRLRAATTRRGQARLSARLGRAHARAATALAPRATSGAPRGVVRTLRGAARSYRRLSVAARRGWPVRYRRARAAVRRHDRALARDLARVR